MVITQTMVIMGIGDFLSIYLFGYMHKSFCQMRGWFKDRKILVELVYAIDWLFLLFANMLEISPVNFSAMIISFVAPMLIVYKSNYLRGLRYYVFYIIATLVMELGVSLSAGVFFTESGMKTQYEVITPGMAVLMNLYEIVIVYLICRFGDKEKEPVINKTSILIMIVPVTSFLIILLNLVIMVWGVVEDYNEGQFVAMTFGIFFANIIIFIVLEKYTQIVKSQYEMTKEKMKLEADTDIMEIASKSMREKLLAMEQIVQNDRVLRHDRRHFEAMIYELLQEGKVEEAKKCLVQRLALEPKTIPKYCDNPTVNAAIGHYIELGKEKGIRFDLSINIPVKLRVDEMELSIALSNLLENAIHACEGLAPGDKYIKFTAKYKQQLLIEIENPCDEALRLDENGLPFTIEHGHGIGTRSVQAFANKTESTISYLVWNGSFKVRMIV